METVEKIIKIANQCLLFSPTGKHSRDLRAHKIKRITTVKRINRRKVLACTKPKNRYIQQHKKRSKAVAADRKYEQSKMSGMFKLLTHFSPMSHFYTP